MSQKDCGAFATALIYFLPQATLPHLILLFVFPLEYMLCISYLLRSVSPTLRISCMLRVGTGSADPA